MIQRQHKREKEIDIQKDAKCVIDLFISLCYCNVHTKDIVFLPASDKSHAGNGFGVGWPFRIGDRKKKERPISSILDVCGTTRTGTDLRQYNLRFLELHPICRDYCSRERHPAGAAPAVAPYRLVFHGKFAFTDYKLYRQQHMSESPIKSRIGERKKRAGRRNALA